LGYVKVRELEHGVAQAPQRCRKSFKVSKRSSLGYSSSGEAQVGRMRGYAKKLRACGGGKSSWSEKENSCGRSRNACVGNKTGCSRSANGCVRKTSGSSVNWKKRSVPTSGKRLLFRVVDRNRIPSHLGVNPASPTVGVTARILRYKWMK